MYFMSLTFETVTYVAICRKGHVKSRGCLKRMFEEGDDS